MRAEKLRSGVVKRINKKVIGLFVDGPGLDRATRRLHKRVDLTSLIRVVCSGRIPAIARYYTLIPYEDDSRHHSFLDAVSRAGLEVVVKRLPPKGITRQVSIDTELACDLVGFSLGYANFGSIPQFELDAEEEAHGSSAPRALPYRDRNGTGPAKAAPQASGKLENSADSDAVPGEPSVEKAFDPSSRQIIIVCPGRDTVYPIAMAAQTGVETVIADFGQVSTPDLLKASGRLIDLSESEVIWKADSRQT